MKDMDKFPSVFVTSQEFDTNSLHVSESEQISDLYKIFRPYLIFGRLLGVVPIQKLYQKDANKLHIKKISSGVLYSLFVIALSLFWLSLSTVNMFQVGKSNAQEIANAASPGIYCLNGIIIYGYFLWNGKAFIRLFQKWNAVSFYLCSEDAQLSKDIAIFTAIMFASGIMENVILQLLQFPVFTSADDTVRYFNLSKNASALEIFYYREYTYLKNLLPYNPYATFLLFLANKLILYAWNYTDILISLVSRVFYYQFKSLIEIGQQKISSEKYLHDPIMWKSLALDHNKLSDILEDFQEFFSPLIFLSYSINTFYSCMQFHGILTPSNDSNLGRAIFAVWSFGQIMLRVLIMTISAARVNENARGILPVLYKCPPECYIPEVERTERSIQYGRQLSFHGLECFQITKSLYLSFLSVLLTFEIVLLQASGSTPKC